MAVGGERRDTAKPANQTSSIYAFLSLKHSSPELISPGRTQVAQVKEHWISLELFTWSSCESHPDWALMRKVRGRKFKSCSGEILPFFASSFVSMFLF